MEITDQHNVASQKNHEKLQDDDGQPTSVNGASADEVTEEDADAYTATSDDEEYGVDSLPPYASAAVYTSDHHSSDSESVTQSIDTQLNVADEKKTEMNSLQLAGKQEYSKDLVKNPDISLSLSIHLRRHRIKSISIIKADRFRLSLCDVRPH